MKNRVKKTCAILSIGALLVVNAVPTFAYGDGFKFTVKKGAGTLASSIVKKKDSERRSYVTVKSAMWSVKDPWIAGFRVRESSGNILTDYYKTRRTGPVVQGGLPFVYGRLAYSGQACRLHAQVEQTLLQ